MADRFRLISALLLLVLGLSACLPQPLLPNSPTPTPTALQPGPTLPPSPTAPAIQTPQVVTATPAAWLRPAQELRGQVVQFWHPWSGAAAEQARSLAAEFNTTNPWGITVEVQQPGSSAALGDALDAGAVADVVAASPSLLYRWQAAGMPIVNLNTYLPDAEWGLSAAQLDDFTPPFWQETATATGQWGIPAPRRARVLYYNQTWGAALGFPNPPRSPKEFRNIACASARSLRLDSDPQNDGFGGWVLDGDAHTLLAWLWAFDWQGMPGDENQPYQFEAQPAQTALEFWRTLLDENCAWTTHSITAQQAFANRQAILISGELGDLSLQTRLMTRTANPDAWVVLPFPTQQQSTLLLTYGESYALFASQPARQLAAWAFLRWMSEAPQQTRLAQAADWLPPSRSAWDALNATRSAQPAWAVLQGSPQTVRPVPSLPSWRIVQHVLEDAAWQLRQPYSGVPKIPALLQQLDAMSAEVRQ